MEFKKRVRVSLIAAGLGAAALVFCGSTKAQEITNSRFSDGPNVVAFESSATRAAATSTVSPMAQPLQSASASDSSATTLANAAGDQNQYDRRSSVLIWGGTLLVWIGAIGLYAGGPAKRFTEQLRAMRKQYAASPNAQP